MNYSPVCITFVFFSFQILSNARLFLENLLRFVDITHWLSFHDAQLAFFIKNSLCYQVWLKQRDSLK